MTKEQLAVLLNGREIGQEIDASEAAEAKRAGLVVVFGDSDDLCEFRGAIYDEAGCYDGGDIFITRTGKLLDEHEEPCRCRFCSYQDVKKGCLKIEAQWCMDGYSWTYATDIPHATFDIKEDGVNYCRGIVFELAAL